MDPKPYLKQLKKDLKESRYLHTIGVTYTAASLAMAHGAELEQAELAGLLHDCAKNLPDQESKALILKHGLEISEFEEKIRPFFMPKQVIFLQKQNMAWKMRKFGMQFLFIRRVVRL